MSLTRFQATKYNINKSQKKEKNQLNFFIIITMKFQKQKLKTISFAMAPPKSKTSVNTRDGVCMLKTKNVDKRNQSPKQRHPMFMSAW